MEDIKALQRQLLSATKTLNSRIRRLRGEDLPSSAEYRIREAEKMETGYITPSGYVSASTKGMSAAEIKQKLKWVRGVTENTETVKQSRALVDLRRREWGVSAEEAKERIRAGRVFYQVLGYRGGVFDSDRVHYAIEEFAKTPSYDTLVNRIFQDYGREMQNEVNGRDELLRWMNKTGIIPAGVNADEDKLGRIFYTDGND